MRKKFEVVQGGGNIDGKRERKFEKGEETVIITDCTIIRETPMAWLIDSPKNEPFWVPKSQCILHTHAKNKASHDVEVPRWLAKEKRLEC